MKKIFLLISTLFLLSGCQAEVNLEITGSKLNEKITITGSNTEEIDNLRKYKVYNNVFVDDQISSEMNEKLEDVEYYEQVFDNNQLQFSYEFGDNDYQRANSVNNCYQFFNYNNQNNNQIISTSKEFSCFNTYPDLDTVVVNIRVDFNVKEHNADRVSGSTYTWILTRNNSDNSIFIHGGEKIENETPNQGNDITGDNTYVSDVNDKEDNNQLAWVLLGLGVFVIVLFVITKIKKGKE